MKPTGIMLGCLWSFTFSRDHSRTLTELRDDGFKRTTVDALERHDLIERHGGDTSPLSFRTTHKGEKMIALMRDS